MSTRSVIAIRDPQNRANIKGVYHHYDGYPSGVGETLYRLLHNATEPQKIIDTLMSKPSGWSTITEWNGIPENAIGYDEMEAKLLPYGYSQWEQREQARKGFAVFYDGKRADPNDKHITKQSDFGWIEWLYLINKNKVYIFEMVSYRFVFRGSFDYTKDEPKWIDFTIQEESEEG